MNKKTSTFIASALCITGACIADISTWNEFRGTTRDGKSTATGLPTTWSETENIVWKTELPGEGHSSPVVADGRIWLTTSPDQGTNRHLLCIDFISGKITKNISLFSYTATNERNHKMNSYATPTPIVEGKRVYVTFGNPGTACLNAETGEIIWQRRDITNRYFDVGAASSPALFGNKLILTSDGEPAAARFVMALDKDTGKTLWRTDRVFPNPLPKYTHASCMPTVALVNGREQLISPGSCGIRSYDLETGKELWIARHEAWSAVPRPVVGEGIVYLCAGVIKPIMMAIQLDKAKGDITGTDAILWSTDKDVPDMSSPLLMGNRLYTIKTTKLNCLEAKTGKVIWSENLKGQHLASIVSAENRMYLFNVNGGSSVVGLGDSFNLISTNKLDSGCYASPAIADKSLIVRTRTHLYRIEKK
ncbi:MAG: PQQ-binding-like beta-propeller repeat protein [bacterium]